MKLTYIIALGMLIVFLSSGCTAFNAGPKMMLTIAEGATALGVTLAAKMNPKDMTARTGGKINDPRFTFKGHIATGLIFEFTAQLVGADLSYDIAAGGQGMMEPDPVILNTITSIWGNSNLNEQERKNMITGAISGWMTNKIKAENAKVAKVIVAPTSDS